MTRALDFATGKVFTPGFVTKTSNFTLTTAESGLLLTWNGSAAGTCTLPAASTGAVYRFLSTSNFSCTLTPAGADTINGLSSLKLIRGQEFELYSDGVSSWRTFNRVKEWHIDAKTASAASTLDFFLPADVDSFRFLIAGLFASANNSKLQFLLAFDAAGTTWITAAEYNNGVVATTASGPGSWQLGASQTAGVLIGPISGLTNLQLGLEVLLHPSTGSRRTSLVINSYGSYSDAAGTFLAVGGGGNLGPTTAGLVRPTGIRFQTDTGTFTGTFQMLGRVVAG